MLDPDEISRAARAMIDNHGGHAAAEAERRAQNLLAYGQATTAASWLRIATAIRHFEEAAAMGQIRNSPRQTSH
jgi:hypothetical protein